MKTRVTIILQTACIILAIGISAQAQPTLVTNVPDASTNFISTGNLVYFTSGDSLLRTDGTDAGTILLRSGLGAFSQLTAFNKMLVFVSGKNLWRSDGTRAGTIHLTARDGLAILPAIGNQLFFQGSEGASGAELYKTDGTAEGTTLVKDINPGVGDGFLGNSAVVGQFLFFKGNDGSLGAELWKSNGTASGTSMVKDINPGNGDGFIDTYFYTDVYGYNNLLYFIGYTKEYGMEPWVSNGSATQTFMLRDVVPGPSDPSSIMFGIGHNGTVYFITKPEPSPANGDAAATLWKTSGTTASTEPLSLLIADASVDGGVTYADPFRIYQGKVYFFGVHDADGPHELWVTDGTQSGSHTVAVIADERAARTFLFFDVVNDYMMFYGIADGNPTQLFRSDGTESGTVAVGYFNSAAHQSVPTKLTEVANRLFYADHDGPVNEGGGAIPDDHYHLFQYDGETRRSMRTLYGISTQGTDNITDHNGRVVFTTRNDHRNSTDKRKYLWTYDPDNSENEQVGKIQHEIWNGLPGTKVSTIPVDSAPSSVTDLTLFETPADLGDNYGGRVRGFVRVPQTGTYTFWIASDDQSQLWLSTDDNPANKAKIADVTGWTNPRQWDKYSSQRSTPVTLIANQKYYIEALMKEGTGRDNLAVGWALPGGTFERPIPATRLIPFGQENNVCAGAGMIRQEFWSDIPGTRVSAIPVNSNPDFVNELTIFEGPATNIADNYGTRIRGYICPPSSGVYTFWIAGDDQTELWLSIDDDPANKIRIAYHTGWTNRREWTRYASQESLPIHLSSNRRYYIEALMKEGSGADHVSVGWRLPDGSLQRPIGGSHLIPFGPAESLCHGTGTILVERWTGIEGSRVTSIPVETTPNATYESLIFQGETNVGDNFGARFSGYICAPMTGSYQFWIASDDHSELWLSTDADRGNKRRIAYLWGWTSPREWTKYSTQQSIPVNLIAGQQYYIEALHKENGGADHMAVGWQLPDGTMERPIYGYRLTPFVQAASIKSADAVQEVESYSGIGIYPNPMSSVDRQLTISGYEDIGQVVETQIEIVNFTGEVVFADRGLCGGDCTSYLINIDKHLVPGIYVVNLKTGTFPSSRRLVVR